MLAEACYEWVETFAARSLLLRLKVDYASLWTHRDNCCTEAGEHLTLVDGEMDSARAPCLGHQRPLSKDNFI